MLPLAVSYAPGTALHMARILGVRLQAQEHLALLEQTDSLFRYRIFTFVCSICSSLVTPYLHEWYFVYVAVLNTVHSSFASLSSGNNLNLNLLTKYIVSFKNTSAGNSKRFSYNLLDHRYQDLLP